MSGNDGDRNDGATKKDIEELREFVAELQIMMKELVRYVMGASGMERDFLRPMAGRKLPMSFPTQRF